MILRLFGYAVREGAGPEFEGLVGGSGLDALESRPGVVFCYAARSMTDPDRGIIVSGWETYDDLHVVVAERIDRPRFLPEALSLTTECDVSHWEAVDLPALGTDETPSVLRLFRGHVEPGAEATYFEHLRSEVWRALAAVPGVAGCWVGRRSDADGSEPVLAVSAWASSDALAAAIGPQIDPVFRLHHGTVLHADRSEEFRVFARIADVRPGLISIR
jgi:heme-degrading monooxygenase HmoA